MPRLPRNVLPPEGLYHVTARGAGQIEIFRDDDDRRTFLALLGKTALREEWACHAYCLMGNHYHLLVETLLERLSAGLQWLNTVYARGFNDRHGRWGHLFGERFSCWVVESDAHAEAASVYIIENPVRAGLCSDPKDWPWAGMRGFERQRLLTGTVPGRGRAEHVPG
jgi:REP-associated tyrosine transposase